MTGSSKRRRSATLSTARARACSNIALAKYWGKADLELNVPAVPSISMTLDQLYTETQVTFDPALPHDEVVLDGRPAREREVRRAVALLESVRQAAGISANARVNTTNNFPTAAGLASSASGFAALAAAAVHAAGLDWSPSRLSRLARRSSASAARSIFGGFVELPAGAPGTDVAAKVLAPPDYWDLRLVVAMTATGPKKVGSTEGMESSRQTSPYYDTWLHAAPKLTAEIRRALRARDLDKLGPAMETSTLCFHTCAMTARPSILYWQPSTVAALHALRDLRDRRGISVWATMDAGPHVKALCHAEDAERVRRALSKIDGVSKTMVTRPGPGIEVGS